MNHGWQFREQPGRNPELYLCGDGEKHVNGLCLYSWLPAAACAMYACNTVLVQKDTAVQL